MGTILSRVVEEEFFSPLVVRVLLVLPHHFWELVQVRYELVNHLETTEAAHHEQTASQDTSEQEGEGEGDHTESHIVVHEPAFFSHVVISVLIVLRVLPGFIGHDELTL